MLKASEVFSSPKVTNHFSFIPLLFLAPFSFGVDRRSRVYTS
jgi:hypothetical protein